jgi:hypothetical protein
VVAVLDDQNNLSIYFGDNLGKSMEESDRKEWYDFLYLIRMFAKRNLMTFSLKNLSRLKYNMKSMAAVKESLYEGYYGNRKVSYSDQPKKTRLIIKHNRTLDEGDARFRYIESLFIENDQGERFKLPFTKLIGGRAMARHVAEGGNPYDMFGQHIVETINDMNTLSSFIRAAKHKNYTGEASHMYENAVRHYQALKTKAKRMISRKGYHEERETFDPAEITDANEAVETIRELFVQQTLDPRVEQALPILAKLAEQELNMKEIKQFESWTDAVMEGTWALPDTPEKQQQLQDLMAQELIVGADSMNATEQLYDLVGDDKLFDRLYILGKQNPNANVWDDPQIQKRFYELGIDINNPSADVNDSEDYDDQADLPSDYAYQRGESPYDKPDTQTESINPAQDSLNRFLQLASVK